ncbi:MAG TPA: hypothetical protein VKR22_03580 [Acidimicrobiales bacterium]|nr:hypothetical protein [Acidimicrobiales bacterium]
MAWAIKHEVHMVIPDGVTFDYPGQHAYYSEIEWSSENRMVPAADAGRFGPEA